MYRNGGPPHIFCGGPPVKGCVEMNRIKKIGIALAAIVVLVLIASVVFGGGYKHTVKNYFRAHEKNDADLMYNSVVAQYWIDYMNEGWGNSAIESVEEGIEENLDEWGCGDNVKITYKIVGKKRATEAELRDLKNNIYDWYAIYVRDRDEFSITDAYVLNIDFVVKGEERTRKLHFPNGLLVIKEDGKWRTTKGRIHNSFYKT